jgi:hypothetical protein
LPRLRARVSRRASAPGASPASRRTRARYSSARVLREALQEAVEITPRLGEFLGAVVQHAELVGGDDRIAERLVAVRLARVERSAQEVVRGIVGLGSDRGVEVRLDAVASSTTEPFVGRLTNCAGSCSQSGGVQPSVCGGTQSSGRLPYPSCRRRCRRPCRRRRSRCSPAVRRRDRDRK